MTGLDRLCRTLRDLGVRHVFGLPGTQNAELFSVLPDHSIRPILPTNETSAAFMANGYGRVSGRVAVLATIPGPGFTYSFPGLAEARLDSAPVLLLTGTPATGGGTRFQHQRIDQAGLAGRLVKEVVEIGSAPEMEPGVRRAYAAALEGEPGPVMVHVAPAALDGSVPERTGEPGAESVTGVDSREWANELGRRVAAARRPVVFAGAGALGSAEAVRELVDRLGCPVFSTVSGRGVVPEDHPGALGFDPDRGRVEELNELLEGADLILALGCKLSHNGTAGFRLELPPEKLIHVNTDPEALGPNYPAGLPIEASVEDALAAVLSELAPGSGPRWAEDELASWKATINSPTAATEPRFHGVEDGSARGFFSALRAALPRDGVVVTDAGLHQYLTRRYYTVLEPGGLMTPTDFQSMGFGLPAALGAKLGAPDRPVVALLGDGGFLFAAMDLLCAVREEIPVVVVVFNDGFLNLIRLQQLRGHGRPSAVELLNPDLPTLAAALGVEYRLVDGDPEGTLRGALETGSPSLVELRVGDSPGIRRLKRRGAARHLVRKTLGQRMIDRLKRFLPGRG